MNSEHSINAFVRSIEYSVPERVLTNEDLAAEFPDWSVDKIAEKTGIHQRHVVSNDETAVDLAAQACERLFQQVPTAKSETDFLLFCTQTPDYQLPNSASLLQDRVSLPTSIGALDINLGCSGYVYGLAVAKGLVAAGLCQSLLLVCADTYSKIIHPDDKSNRVLFGDAATVTQVSSTGPGLELGEFVFSTDGNGFDSLIVRNSGTKYGWNRCDAKYDEDGNFLTDDSALYMDGPSIFKFASSQVPKLVQQLMMNEGLETGDVDRFIFHQANRYMLEHLRRRMRIPTERFVVEMAEFGNTVSSSIPIAISESLAKKPCAKGELLLLAGFGVGLSMAACTMRMPEHNLEQTP